MAMNFVTFNQDYSHLAVGMAFQLFWLLVVTRVDQAHVLREDFASSLPTLSPFTKISTEVKLKKA